MVPDDRNGGLRSVGSTPHAACQLYFMEYRIIIFPAVYNAGAMSAVAVRCTGNQAKMKHLATHGRQWWAFGRQWPASRYAEIFCLHHPETPDAWQTETCSIPCGWYLVRLAALPELSLAGSSPVILSDCSECLLR